MQLVRAALLALALTLAGCAIGILHEKRYAYVRGFSMVPAYGAGDRVTVDLDAYRSARPRRGDVVLVHPPQGASLGRCGNPSQPADGHPCARPSGAPNYRRALVRRIAAVGGDWIAIRRNRVYLGRNAGGPFAMRDAPRVKGAGKSCLSPLCNLPKPAQVPPGTYFVMGDNREPSDDSRRWGPVPVEWIDGKVGR
jgi:signal peptidase I